MNVVKVVEVIDFVVTVLVLETLAIFIRTCIVGQGRGISTVSQIQNKGLIIDNLNGTLVQGTFKRNVFRV